MSSITEALNLVGAMRIATKSIPEGEDCLRFTGGQIFKGKDHAYVLFKHTFVTELESFGKDHITVFVHTLIMRPCNRTGLR